MKINLVSDLHLEFADLELPGGDVLILAGDICETKNVRPCSYDPNGIVFSFESREKRPDRYIRFFKEECTKYQQVFYVMGNHEHYHGRFDKTANLIREFLPYNCILLDNDYIEYNGVIFIGSTLWTDCNKLDHLTMLELKECMNDYRVVTNFYKEKGQYYKLQPEVTIKQHEDTIVYFDKIINQYKDKPVVVVTHHAPSFMSVNEKYKKETLINGGYASDLSEFILDHPNIKVWCHGHMHFGVDYSIGQTRVLANPRGYVPYEQGNGFNPNFIFEV